VVSLLIKPDPIVGTLDPLPLQLVSVGHNSDEQVLGLDQSDPFFGAIDGTPFSIVDMDQIGKWLATSSKLC
jgi:hypothetical protein